MRLAIAIVLAAVLAAPAATAVAQPAPAGTFAVVPGQSTVEFFVRDNRGGFVGRSDQLTGSLTVRRRDDGAYVADLDLSLDARTIRTGIGLRDDQMRGALGTGTHPFITFKGSAVAERITDATFDAAVRGTMTVRGVSREITLNAAVARAGDAYRGDAKTGVRMTDFGITPPRLLFLAAEDPVALTIHIETARR